MNPTFGDILAAFNERSSLKARLTKPGAFICQAGLTVTNPDKCEHCGAADGEACGRLHITMRAEIDRLRAQSADLGGMLLDVLEYLDNYVDVVDGDYGQPAPNKAMRLVQEIEEMLTKAGVDHGRKE